MVSKIIKYNTNCKPKEEQMLGQRIQRARKALGLSLRELGEQISLSHAAIKKYEHNEMTPSSDVLIKLAKALQVRIEYFFRPAAFVLKNIQYRKHADLSKRYLGIVTAQILDKIERRIELENLFPNSPLQLFSLKALPKAINKLEDIEELANLIRNQWNLGLDPLPDMIDVFEKQGIKIFEIENEQYSNIDGFCAEVNEMPVIVISQYRPGDRQRFTLAHELGHLVLDNRLSSKLDIELCCNRFAGAFLLPKQSLIDLLGSHRNSIEPRELSLLKQEFGISMTSILHRAEDLGIISNSLYQELRTAFNKRGWTQHEPGKQYPKERQHVFEQMVFRAFAEGYIVESKAAELMNIPLEQFRSLRAMECNDVINYH